MDSDSIQRLRAFNRIVTARVGALDDEYLARGRPLGASRVLWEIGDDGTDVRRLRTRLDLDSGYLSRLLRSLEQEGLIASHWGVSENNRRAKFYALTARGRKRLIAETENWHRISGVVHRVLDASAGGEVSP